MQELSALRERVDTWRDVERRAREQVELLELALEEDDDSFAESAGRGAGGDRRSAWPAGVRAAALWAITTSVTRFWPCMRERAAPSPRTGRRCSCACSCAGADSHGYETEVLDTTEGEEAGIKSATIEGPWPSRLRLPRERTWRSPPRAPFALRCRPRAPHELRQSRGHARGELHQRGRGQPG